MECQWLECTSNSNAKDCECLLGFATDCDDCPLTSAKFDERQYIISRIKAAENPWQKKIDDAPIGNTIAVIGRYSTQRDIWEDARETIIKGIENGTNK